MRRNSPSLCFRLDRNSWHLSSTSRIDTSMTSFPIITKTLRVIWARCMLLSLRSKTRRRATLLLPIWITPIDRGGQLCTSNLRQQTICKLNITHVNVRLMNSNIQSSSACDVYISQLIRYAKGCSSYEFLFWVRCNFRTVGASIYSNAWRP